MEQKLNRVCLVDDETDVLAALSSSLESTYDVHSFTSAQAMLDAFDKGLEVDLLISDLKMPSMDGLSLIENLRARQFNRKIILSSGNAEKDDVIRAMQLGVSDVIEKPYTVKKLKETVAGSIAGRTSQTWRDLQMSAADLVKQMRIANDRHFERLVFVENRIFELSPNGFQSATEVTTFLKLISEGRIAFKELEQATQSFLKELEKVREKAVS